MAGITPTAFPRYRGGAAQRQTVRAGFVARYPSAARRYPVHALQLDLHLRLPNHQYQRLCEFSRDSTSYVSAGTIPMPHHRKPVACARQGESEGE